MPRIKYDKLIEKNAIFNIPLIAIFIYGLYYSWRIIHPWRGFAAFALDASSSPKNWRKQAISIYCGDAASFRLYFSILFIAKGASNNWQRNHNYSTPKQKHKLLNTTVWCNRTSSGKSDNQRNKPESNNINLYYFFKNQFYIINILIFTAHYAHFHVFATNNQCRIAFCRIEHLKKSLPVLCNVA